MPLPAFWAALLLAGQVISLPVTNPATQDDAKVMKCIAEVISDTVSKPNPLPISQECLETLQGDERIRSILRHQNLLKELQEIAIQGANERTEQQKKSHGFEDELSEVLETQSDGNTERELSEGSPSEDPIASLAELEEAEKSQKNSERDISKEEERNSLEEREPRAQDVGTEDDKENTAGFESNEVGEAEELPWDDAAVDNHIHDDVQDEEPPQQKHQEDEEDVLGTDEFEEKEHASRHSHESKEEREDSVRDRAEEEEEDQEDEEEEEVEEEKDDDEEVEEEKERNTSEEEHPTEDMEDQREDDNQDIKGFAEDEKLAEDKERYHHMKGGRHHSLDDARQDKDTSRARDTESEEVEADSQDLDDAKRWNKMDELAKQLTTTKRAEETESNEEDPDRSMKLVVRSHKYDFRNSEDNERRPQKHHSKEESSEGGFPLVAMPEEKKDEEGSANRKTEDQELESLVAIEAELEKVAHKLHALRRG